MGRSRRRCRHAARRLCVVTHHHRAPQLNHGEPQRSGTGGVEPAGLSSLVVVPRLPRAWGVCLHRSAAFRVRRQRFWGRLRYCGRFRRKAQITCAVRVDAGCDRGSRNGVQRSFVMLRRHAVQTHAAWGVLVPHRSGCAGDSENRDHQRGPPGRLLQLNHRLIPLASRLQAGCQPLCGLHGSSQVVAAKRDDSNGLH